MAGVAHSEVVRKNAQALELFTRTSPVTASFLECFTADPAQPSRLLFSYEEPASEKTNPAAAIACEMHMQKLDSRISIHPPQIPDFDDERIGLYYSIDLSDPQLKDIILDVTAQVINAERQKNPGYTLSYFPTQHDQYTGAVPWEYNGIKDKSSLQARLNRPFEEDVTPQDLEKLARRMAYLPRLFRGANPPLPPR